MGTRARSPRGRQKAIATLSRPPSVAEAYASARAPDNATVAGWADRTGGHRLPAAERQRLERSFGARLDGVRVHTDPFARAATTQVGASAFAAGRNLFFGPDAYEPSTTRGQRLIAHEVAHTLQQRRGPALGGLASSHDPAEREADAAAARASAGGRATIRERTAVRVLRAPPHTEIKQGHGRGALKTKAGSTETPAYDEDSGLDARSYIRVHQVSLWPALVTKLTESNPRTGSPYLGWRGASARLFARTVLMDAWTDGLGKVGLDSAYATLYLIVQPDFLDDAIDQARDSMLFHYGPPEWIPEVTDEIALLLKKRLDESLRRLAARYVAVKNQRLLRVERGLAGATAAVAAEEMFFEHPIDRWVLAGLEAGAEVDTSWYRKAFPSEAAERSIATQRAVTLAFRCGYGRLTPNWVRATPDDATVSEVAAALFGSASSAWALTDVHPLFQFEPKDADQFTLPYKLEFAKIQLGQVAAPEPESTSDIARAHAARKVVPTPGLKADADGKKVIDARWSDMIRFLGEAEAAVRALSAPPAPAPGAVATPAISEPEFPHLAEALQHRATMIGYEIRDYRDPADVVAQDQVTLVQRQAIQDATRGIRTTCTLGKAYGNWPRVGTIVAQVLVRFDTAIRFAEFVDTGAEFLAIADRSLRLAPVDILDAMLASLRRATRQAEGDRTAKSSHDRNDTAYLLKIENQLRADLYALRDLVLTNPDAASKELERIIGELGKLETGVSLVSNLDAIDSAWRALYDNLSAIGVITRTNAKMSDGMSAVLDLRSEWYRVYYRWQFARDARDDAGMKAASDALRDPENRKKLQALFDRVRTIIDDAETLNFWVSFGVMVGLAIITAGVGSLVFSAARAAWGVYAAFAVTTLTEAAYMTLMTTLLFDKDPSFGGVTLSFVKNLVTFALLRGISMAYVSRVGEVAAGTASGQMKLMLIQYAAMTMASVIEAEAETWIRHGRHVTLEEVVTIALHNAAFMIAVTLGTRLAKPGLEAAHEFGHAKGTQWRIAKLRRQIGDTTTRLRDSQGKDPALLQEIIDQHAALIVEEGALITALDTKAANPKTAHLVDPKKLAAWKAGHADSIADHLRIRVTSKMRAIGDDAVGIPTDTYDLAQRLYKDVEKKEVKDLTSDARTGARAFTVELEPGRTVTVVERLANPELIDLPVTIRNRPAPTAAEVAANQTRADEARVIDAQRRAEIKVLVDADPAPTFKRVILGGGSGAVTNAATLPAAAGAKLGPGPVTHLPDVIVVQAKAEPWGTRGEVPSGQTPGELDNPVFKVSDFALDQRGYAPSKAIGDAVVVARVEHGVPTFEGAATGHVEVEPSAGAWPKPLRVLVDGKFWYADAVDVTAGIGPARKLGAHQLSTADEATLTADKRVVYGDEHLADIKPGAAEVLVTGGSATSAWNAEAAARSGAGKVHWVHRPSAPEAGTKEAIELAELATKLRDPALDASTRIALEQRQADLLSFRRAMLPRNVEPPDAAFKHPAISRSSGTIKKVTPTADGRVKVEVADGRVFTVDQVVVSIGQDPAAAGGPLALTQGRRFRIVKNAAGELTHLESVDPPGAIRIMGASMSEPAMREAVIPAERAEFAALLARQANALPTNSRGVAGSLALAGQTIPEANRILAANDAMTAAGFKLPGGTRTLTLRPGEEPAWPQQVGEFVARELGVDPGRITVHPLAGGRSGASVFKVMLGDADVGVFKVFSNAADAAAEAKAIDAIASKHLKNFQVVGDKGSVNVDAGGTAKSGLMMEVAPGKTVKQLVDGLPESGPLRDAAVHDLAVAAAQVGKAMGEFHKSFETGHEMARAAKESEASNLIRKMIQIEPLVDPAVYEALRAQVIDRIAAFYNASIPETAYHGDANIGNFAVGPGGKVTTFDVGTMKWSIDASGKPVASGAADVARFAVSLASDNPGRLTPTELDAVRTAFGKAYFAATGTTRDGLLPAVRFYQIDMELGIMVGQNRAGLGIAEPLGRLLAALELPPAARSRSDADLALDVDPTPRIGETAEAAQQRAALATAERDHRNSLPMCFVAGTRVHTPTGAVAIETIAVGQLVVARDEDAAIDAPTVSGRVRAVSRGSTLEVCHLTIDGERVTSTRTHRYHACARGWTPAHALNVGDRIATVSGDAVIEAIEFEQLAAPVATYNLSVEDARTYFVSAANGRVGIWVHNVDPKDPVFDQKLLWGLGGSGPRLRVGEDTDGASAFETSNSTDAGRLFGARVAAEPTAEKVKATAKANHGAITSTQLADAGLVAVETPSTHPISTEAGIKHYSIRPATNPDPKVPLTDAEMTQVKAKLDAIAPTVQAKPRDFGCG